MLAAESVLNIVGHPSTVLRVYPLQFSLETLAGFRLPEYTGALFRGGFGQFFRDLVCLTRQPACGGCPHLSACPYSLVFETPVLPERFAVLRKYPNAPHPFVLAPQLTHQTWIGSRHILPLDITLIGHAVEYLPHFLRVFEAMGSSGRYGGRFGIREVLSAVTGEVVYDGLNRRMHSQPAELNIPGIPGHTSAGVRRLQLEFLTPLRMRTEGRYNSEPTFAEITQALLRRIHLLRELYGSGEGSTAWTHPLLSSADKAVTEEAKFNVFHWDRMSGRQHRRINMDGVLGTITVSGELTSLARWFELGTWLHVGSGTSMGMGRYKMHFQS